MGAYVQLKSEVAKRAGLKEAFTTYVEEPQGQTPKGGLVIVQELFGVNGHIRDMCRTYAKHGYEVMAPALFDHVEKGVELGYDERATGKGRDFTQKLGWDLPLADLTICARTLRDKPGRGRMYPVAVLGYCWGGSLAWLAATRTPVGTFSAAISYYGRHAPDFKIEQPGCPVMFHFGETDPLIPIEKVKELQALHSKQTFHLYAAGHGFNCNQRKDFNAAAAQVAEVRTLEFLKKHLQWS